MLPPSFFIDSSSRVSTRQADTNLRNVCTTPISKLHPSDTTYRDEEHMAQTRPIIHLPPILLPASYSISVGSSIRRRLLTNTTNNTRLHLRPLPSKFPSRINSDVLPSRQITRSRCSRMARQTETRTLRTTRKSASRAVGVWVLLRCMSGYRYKRWTERHMLNTFFSQVSIRAFFPIWVFLYVVQFLLMPVVSRDFWVSEFFGNSLYLIAFGYYFVITFLGYNGMFVLR